MNYLLIHVGPIPKHFISCVSQIKKIDRNAKIHIAVDEDIAIEDVNIFNPDRDFRDEEFFFDKGLASYNPSSERFSPFTYGPRDCIGKNFSQIEMRLILIHILKDFTFSLSPKQLGGYDQNNISFNSVTLAPRSIYNSTMTERNYGMYVKLIPRNIISKL